jgi:predicted nuclease of predicted toxin-antitoxin system
LRFKLDENIGRRGAALLDSEGHDVSTVLEERLSGAADSAVLAAAIAERRVIITLDHDFGNVLRFPPEESCGVVILQTPDDAAPESIDARLRDFLAGLETSELGRELWIVEPGRIRVHEDR